MTDATTMHARIRETAEAGARQFSAPRGSLAAGRLEFDLAFDEQELGAVGGPLRLETPGAGGTEDRYEIEISGGAAHVQVTTE